MVGIAAAVLAAIAVVVVAASIGGARPSGSAVAAAGPRERGAHAAALDMLATLRLPAGAVPAATDTSVARRLAAPGDRLGTVDQVDLTRFWHLPGDPDAMIRWLKGHTPSGSRLAGTGEGAVHGVAVTWTAVLTFPGTRGEIISRELAIETAAARAGGTAVRVDSEAAWQIARDPSLRIPARLSHLTVTTGQLLAGAGRTRTVRSQRQVHRLASLINALPLSQPGLGGCTLDRGFRVRLTFTSTDPSAAAAVAVVNPACGTIALTVDGHQQQLTVSLPNWDDSRYRTLIRRLESGSI
jgi:hypothetical protein